LDNEGNARVVEALTCSGRKRDMGRERVQKRTDTGQKNKLYKTKATLWGKNRKVETHAKNNTRSNEG